MSMPTKQRHPQNVAGSLFVDHSCIDCDTCRWMSSTVFGRTKAGLGGQSVVYKQPESDAERKDAYAAMVACPTGSIRLETPDPLMREVIGSFPRLIDPSMPGVFHLGFHDEMSFGATPYLVAGFAKDEAGNPVNVMMDTPRFSERLAKAIDAVGGLHYYLLSHKDDVASMEKWKARFPGVKRVMHEADITTTQQWPYIDTTSVEIKLPGSEREWKLLPGLSAIHTPGHSQGSVTFIASAAFTGGEACAFTGDHLCFSSRLGRIDGMGRYGWDTNLQADSIRRLADEEFLWILPGHGRRYQFRDETERHAAITKAADDFKKDPLGKNAPGPVFSVVSQ
eukprot:CAMPEP_0118962696 /NCGR_PEP_ID=MMETSP1173-20130426/933_1 /TAXON_ID=1034831 /ORGANISM="Rhizochromulina marina cf, Strain CCMP1243" /LENGTH=336 /DNA_ID=CAMNT_0006910985 /DNA_START=100 /DNA_END=1110 /DNA_ORIENTATION=+